VTGASTGIGRELTLRLARLGVRVAASARSAQKLEAMACAQGNILPVPLDVTRLADVASAHRSILVQMGDIDLAILNAGIWEPMRASAFSAELATHSMQVNYCGIANALASLIPAMIARGSGQIAMMASVAGYRGLPMAAAYAPSKAAVISLAEVLRLELERHHVIVSVINPGFVETPMTAGNRFPMPHILPVEDAAKRILHGLERGNFEIAFPWPLVATLKALRVLPNRLYFRLAARLAAR
jgi:short-subunit dehydrogenase